MKRIKSNKTYLEFTYYNEKCKFNISDIDSKIFFYFDRFSCIITNCQKIFCVPSICLKLNHQIIGVLINDVLNKRFAFKINMF